MVQRRSRSSALASGAGAARYRTRYGWPQPHTPGNPSAPRVAPQPEHWSDHGNSHTGMQSIENAVRQLAREPGQRGDLGRRCRLHARERAEPLEQRAPPARPDARYREQLRRDGAPGAAVAAVADREAMRLVAGALQELERRAASGQRERLGAARDEDLFLALREAHDRQLLPPRGPRRVERRAELTLPPVDDHEVGERLVLGDPSREVARHDLVHRREIVLGRAPDLEPPILRLLGAAPLEPDEPRPGIAPLRGRGF